MRIREQLAAHDARFISVSGLINDIADDEGVTFAEVARLLILDGVLNHLQTRLKLHGHGGYSEGGDAAANFELENAICDGKARLDDCAQNEFREGEPGFFRDEVAEALKVAGWRVPSTLAGQMAEVSKLPPTPRERPDLLPFVPRVNISLAEAADILREANGGEWWAALEDAVDSDQIKAGTWGAYRGEQPLSHADIRAWCEAGGIIWPVPPPPGSIPATDEGLREALAVAQAKCEALHAELASLRAEHAHQTAQTDDWTRHATSVFKLLPRVIAMGRASSTWPKQAALIPEMMTELGITEAEAKALDTVTRPDELRRK